ncbi:lipoprotein 17-related variable surface protein [Mycoplasma seminis]|uniref:Lipoprotein 17-related variable surface protein n=1 Tax=Mycoplasma seminis TaxID=512749 RepID=A0ABY9HBD8_9MOLU|nr:lipoprotein 17-related variable surface protein [Mycoplasma seminis]WLP85914.1 lipoprotein 17-related variable surface protein [Mycoplasma seminis]
MRKFTKTLLITLGGATATALPLISISCGKTEATKEEVEKKLKETKVVVDTVQGVNKAEVLASTITTQQLAFSGYDPKIFKVTVGTLSADDKAGTLSVPYTLQSIKYESVKSDGLVATITGFKTAAATDTPAPAAKTEQQVQEELNNIKLSVALQGVNAATIKASEVKQSQINVTGYDSKDFTLTYGTLAPNDKTGILTIPYTLTSNQFNTLKKTGDLQLDGFKVEAAEDGSGKDNSGTTGQPGKDDKQPGDSTGTDQGGKEKEPSQPGKENPEVKPGDEKTPAESGNDQTKPGEGDKQPGKETPEVKPGEGQPSDKTGGEDTGKQPVEPGKEEPKPGTDVTPGTTPVEGGENKTPGTADGSEKEKPAVTPGEGTEEGKKDTPEEKQPETPTPSTGDDKNKEQPTVTPGTTPTDGDKKETPEGAAPADKEQPKEEAKVTKASELTAEQFATLIGEAKPTIKDEAKEKTAFDAAIADLNTPTVENADYVIEFLSSKKDAPTFTTNIGKVLFNEKTPTDEKTEVENRLFAGERKVNYSIKVTSKTDNKDFKVFEKEFLVSGYKTKEQVMEILKAAKPAVKEQINTDVITIEPSTEKGYSVAYKFLHGKYTSFNKLDAISLEEGPKLKVAYKLVEGDTTKGTAKVLPIIYYDNASKNFYFVYKDLSTERKDDDYLQLNGLPIPALSAKAIADNYKGTDGPTGVYEIDAKVVEKNAGKPLSELYPSEITMDMLKDSLVSQPATLIGSAPEDKYQITAEMLKEMNGTITGIKHKDDLDPYVIVTVQFDTVKVENGIYYISKKEAATKDYEVAKNAKGEFSVRLAGLKVKTPEPDTSTPKPGTNVGGKDNTTPATPIVQGTAFKLAETATAANIENVIKAKSANANNFDLQYYDKRGYFGIKGSGNISNSALLLLNNVPSDEIKLVTLKGKNKGILNCGSYDATTKTLTVKYQQKINNEFKDVQQSFVLA